MNLFSKRGRAGRALGMSRRRDVRFAPSLSDTLEIRQMLTAGPLGLNLDSIEYVDAMKTAAGWAPVYGQSSITHDANGWPTSDASVLVADDRVNQGWNGPDANAVAPDLGGTYSLSFQGRAVVQTQNWSAPFTVQNQVYNAGTNTTTAQLVVPHNPLPLLDINFSNTVNPASATGAGVSSVQLFRPGYALNTTQVFTTNYLNAIKPFGTLRYLNIDAANNFGVTLDANNKLVPLQWSQRKTPVAYSQIDSAYGGAGQAWEYMIALANASNTDMWINIPGPATDDYVTQLANLIKNGDTVNGVTYAGLNPNLKIYVEYSNEVWGGTPPTTAYNQEAAKEALAAGDTALNNDGSTDPFVWSEHYYLQRSMQIATDFRNVFGADPTDAKVRPVAVWQENNSYFFQNEFPWFQTTFGAPKNTFYGMGQAIYLQPTDYSSVDSVISSLQAQQANEASTDAVFTTLAGQFGMKNVSYEGGPGVGSTGTAGQNALAASRDPRMEQIVSTLYQNWYAAGGDEACFFDGPYGAWSPQNEWPVAELYQAANPSLAPKYRGLLDVANASPTIPTLGTSVSANLATSLSTTSDSLGQRFALPVTGTTNDWILNVATPGTYDLSVTTGINSSPAQNYSAGQVQVAIDSQPMSGVATVTQGGTFSLGPIVLHSGLNVLSINIIHGFADPTFPANVNRYLFQPTALTITPTVQMTTAGGAGFSDSGSWTPQGAAVVAPAGGNASNATWTFNVSPGIYRVSAIWGASPSASPDAPYTILDGSNVLATVPVNQKVAPAGFNDGTTNWLDLGTSFTVLGNSLTIRLNSSADGTVSAQSIRIQQLQAIPSAQIINDNNNYDLALVGPWSHVGDTSFTPGNSGDVVSTGNPGASATFTFPVTPGLYKISSIWPGGAGFSPDATYTIYDGLNVLAPVRINQQVASVGYNDGNVSWQDLGGPYTITGHSLVVRVSGAGDGQVEAQAIRIQPILNASGPPTLAPIADQSVSPYPASLAVTLNGNDPGGLPLTYSAQAQSLNSILKTSYGFSEASFGYLTNGRGQQEKYLLGTASSQGYAAQGSYWYYLLPNGDLYEMNPASYSSATLAGVKVAGLGVAVYSDPSLLWNASNAPVATLSVVGNVVTITPNAGFVGTMVVTATTTDGKNSASQTFKVTAVAAVSGPPTLAPIADQSVSPYPASLAVTLNGNDPGGLPLTYSAQAQSLNSILKTSYGFSEASFGYLTNGRGQQEKYLLGTASSQGYAAQGSYWYYLLPNGDLYEMNPASYSSATLAGVKVAGLGVAVYSDPSLLWNASNAPVATLSVVGNVVTITPNAGFVGTMVVTATTTDGKNSASQKFKVTVPG